MNDLTFLFFLIPGAALSFAFLAIWLVVRQQRQIQRDIFGEAGAPLFASLFPTSKAGMRYYAGQSGTNGSHHGSGHHTGSNSSHHFGPWDHGSSSSDHHGWSSDYSSGSGYSSGSDCGSGYDSGSSSSSSSSSSCDSSSSSSSSSDSGSSSW